jgi:hypothetical protein
MTERYDRFWAAFLGITPAELNERGTSVAAHVGLKGYNGVWFFRRNQRTVVSAPIDWVSVLRERVGDVDDATLLMTRFYEDIFGEQFERLVGPAFQGYLAPQGVRVGTSIEVHLLGSKGSADIDSFRVLCGHEAWEYSGLDEATQYWAAVHVGDRVVSLAGYRAWTEEAGDVCVLTHAAHRDSGFGTEAAQAVVSQALQDGKLLLYQTLESNIAAVKIARRIGYEPYARHVAVRLRAKAAH